jgi:hypothetical protein
MSTLTQDKRVLLQVFAAECLSQKELLAKNLHPAAKKLKGKSQSL